MGKEPSVRILVVCSGNICRSPMVAEYLRHRAAASALDQLLVDSAGTLGIEDRPAAPEAVETLREVGLDLSEHRSKGIAEIDLVSSDVVLGMEPAHWESLDARFARGPSVRWLLRAFESGPRPDPSAQELQDPIGQPIEAYRECFDIIRPCVDHLIQYLERLGSDRDDGNRP